MKVTLKQFNYETNQVDDLGEVDTRTIAKNLSYVQMADLLESWLNSGSSAFGSGEKMGRIFQETHRTLQGLITNMALGILSGLGETDPRWTDPRNKQAIVSCNTIKKMIDDGDLKLQPFI